MINSRHISTISILSISIQAFAFTFPANTHYELCFTPQHNCTEMLIQRINAAKTSIDMQGYSFTSYPIAKALVRAHERGVKVRGIFDKSNFQKQYFSFAPYLQKHGIPIWKDSPIGIAHNKVMIIDAATVETGSFNFTKAAQKKNAENMLIIDSKKLAAQYEVNFLYRKSLSKKM